MGFTYSRSTSLSKQNSIQLQNKDNSKSPTVENTNIKQQNNKVAGITQALHMAQTNIYEIPIVLDQPHISSGFNQLHRQQNFEISQHTGFLFINTILLASFISVVVLLIIFKKHQLVIAFMGLPNVIFIYLIYLICASKQQGVVNHIGAVNPGANFQTQYNRARAMLGKFHLSVRCYSQGFDSENDPIEITSQTFDEIVNTKTTEDISGDLDASRAKGSHFIVAFIVKHIFAEEQSQINLDKYYTNFCAQNNKDVKQEGRCIYQLPELNYSQTFSTADCFCTYKSLYVLFVLFGLGWFYIKWMNSRFERYTVTITKRVTV